MPDIPEHLLRRSAERRKALGLPGPDDEGAEEAAAPAKEAAPPAEGAPPAAGAAAAVSAAGGEGEEAGESKGGVPAHLLERAKRRRAATKGEDAGTATVGAGGSAAATKTAAAPAPAGTGPGGHTQRLLTVVKAGSIQQTKAEAQDKVHTWPHLLAIEFAAALGMLALVTIFSALVRAPLLSLADINQTPNPSKAPWYFLGLQELLTMFQPMVAGVTIPGIALVLFAFAPYIDKNPSTKPADRKFAIALFTMYLMFWAVLVIIGSFFRGPGFNFTFPWNDGIFFDL